MIEGLHVLESAAEAPDGIYQEGTPSAWIGYKLFEAGLMDQLEPETFFGGKYRINDNGRAFVQQHSIPASWEIPANVCRACGRFLGCWVCR